jgi:hypothetical protein
VRNQDSVMMSAKSQAKNGEDLEQKPVIEIFTDKIE